MAESMEAPSLRTDAARKRYVRENLHYFAEWDRTGDKFSVVNWDAEKITVRLVRFDGTEDLVDVVIGVADEKNRAFIQSLTENADQWRHPVPGDADFVCPGDRPQQTQSDTGGSLKPIWLSDVEPEDVTWFWNNRIPQGKLTLLMGDPGVGKSFWTCDAAARASRGDPWPDGSPCPQGKTLLFSAEDGVADTIRPRFDAAGGDPTQVAYLNTLVDEQGNRLPFTLDKDVPKLVELVKAHPDIKLIIIDPISCYMGKSDTNKNAEVRACLSLLAELAEKYRVTILAVTHLNKSGNQSAKYRATSSLGFIAAARAAWLICEDRDDETEQKQALFLPVKWNLAPKQKGLAFRIERGRLEWQEGTIDIDADTALAPKSAAEKTTKQERARDAIARLLAGGPMLSTEVYKAVREEVGCSERIVDFGRDMLDVVWTVGEDGRRFMGLKTATAQSPPRVAPLRPLRPCAVPGTDETDRRTIEHVRGIA